ncbi:MAG: C69 family dipeptidase, partial [Bacteroidales bacterium]|nr:C69 family dipeptidase [Bacteroidales bacterium]
MKRKILLAALLSLALPAASDACTNVIVTRGASKDGSVLVSYAADSHYLFGELYYHPAADWENGSKLKVNEWDTGRYLCDIPQVPHTFQTVGNMNEHQLIITETTWGGRSELEDKNGQIDYGSLIYITLQRAKTAREAIDIIVELANTWGYASEGESFSIADKNEVWIMELIGKGMNIRNRVNTQKGIVWVAVRIPDGAISGHANQARIGKFPLNDPDNCLYAPDVISFARKKGYFDGPDEEFSFKKAYGPADFGTVRGCDARVWSAFNILTDGWFSYYDENGRGVTKDAYTWLDYVMGKNLDKDLPLYVYPRRKVGVKDVADVMRDHFEGSPMDMTQDIGAGGNALPY